MNDDEAQLMKQCMVRFELIPQGLITRLWEFLIDRRRPPISYGSAIHEAPLGGAVVVR
jgi:hypothetical protein